jgi:hypothetical protein
MKVKANRFWIEIIAISSAVACALALLLATLGAATAAADPAQPAQTQEQTYEGMVTDTHCGARHEAAIGKGSSDCTRACVHAGAQFALVNGDKMYTLTGDLETLKRSAGQRSVIIGTLNGDTIAVSSITAKI